MKCDRCNEVIEEGEEHEKNGQFLCEDCYITALSPPRTCDPWAVHSAKSFADKSEVDLKLTETQVKILDLLEETGGVKPEVISEKIGIKPSQVQREIATLRHMEKVRAALKDGVKVICLW